MRKSEAIPGSGDRTTVDQLTQGQTGVAYHSEQTYRPASLSNPNELGTCKPKILFFNLSEVELLPPCIVEVFGNNKDTKSRVW
jgi:hypothetical protein